MVLGLEEPALLLERLAEAIAHVVLGRRLRAGGAGPRGRCRSPRPWRRASWRLQRDRGGGPPGRGDRAPIGLELARGARGARGVAERQVGADEARPDLRPELRPGPGGLGLEESADGLVGRAPLERDPARLHERVAAKGVGRPARWRRTGSGARARRPGRPSRASATPRQNGISARIGPGAPLWTTSSQRATASAGRSEQEARDAEQVAGDSASGWGGTARSARSRAASASAASPRRSARSPRPSSACIPSGGGGPSGSAGPVVALGAGDGGRGRRRRLEQRQLTEPDMGRRRLGAARIDGEALLERLARLSVVARRDSRDAAVRQRRRAPEHDEGAREPAGVRRRWKGLARRRRRTAGPGRARGRGCGGGDRRRRGRVEPRPLEARSEPARP